MTELSRHHAEGTRSPLERRHRCDAHLGTYDGEDEVVVCVCDTREGAYFEIPPSSTSPSRSTATRSPTGTPAPSTTKTVASRRSPMVEVRHLPARSDAEFAQSRLVLKSAGC
jgi:hypothetical protein